MLNTQHFAHQPDIMDNRRLHVVHIERTPIKMKPYDDRELPSDGYVIDNWMTTTEVMKTTGLRSQQGVVHAINAGRLRGKKVGSARRGQWYVDPESVEHFERTKRGPKSGDEPHS